MIGALFIGIMAYVTTIVQIGFFSHLSFPWSTFSVPLAIVAYGIVRERPLLALGWATLAGMLIDLHGLGGFGTETIALFVAFFSSRFLFHRVLTNKGAVAMFLLGATTAMVRWFVLTAMDGIGVLFGHLPTTIDLSSTTFFAPLRHGLVNGIAVLLLIGIEELTRRRFRKTFLSHATSTNAFS